MRVLKFACLPLRDSSLKQIKGLALIKSNGSEHILRKEANVGTSGADQKTLSVDSNLSFLQILHLEM